MKLLTLSDGFGDSLSTPLWYPKYWKWPEIIRLMTRGLRLHNASRYGAGNEYIMHQLLDNFKDADKIMVQWAQPDRLDLVLTEQNESFWQDVIANDPMYHGNVMACKGEKFWLSSASTIPEVRLYHTRYVTMRQHQMRSSLLIEHAKLLLQHHDIDYRFMLTESSDYLDVDAKWICHEPKKGMRQFKQISKYAELDLGFVQPVPLVAFDFIKQFVMPSIDLPWRQTRDIDAVENMLYRHYQEVMKSRNDIN